MGYVSELRRWRLAEERKLGRIEEKRNEKQNEKKNVKRHERGTKE